MTIVALKKLTVCGLSSAKAQMLEILQDLGCAHLIALRRQDRLGDTTYVASRQKAWTALKYLAQCPYRKTRTDNMPGFDWNQAVDEILAIKQKIGELQLRREALRERIEELEPWGDFSFPGAALLQGLRFWFYCVPEALMAEVKRTGLSWQCVHETGGLYYIVVIDKDEPPPASLPVRRRHLGSMSLSRLKWELEELDRDLQDLQARRQSLTQWSAMIAAGLAEAEDREGLHFAESIAIDNDGIFIIQAWIPTAALTTIEHYARQHDWALLHSDPEVGDNPPTLLSNPDVLAGGEELIKFYHPPGYFGWDPSVMLYFSFAVFFSMILSDAGYAVFFALLLAFYWRKFEQSKQGLRLRSLAAASIVSAFFWGIAIGSYFGINPSADSPLAALVIMRPNDLDAMMALSLAVGTAHIAIANAVRFYCQRGRAMAWSYLGWLLVVIGGFLLWYSNFMHKSIPQALNAVLLGVGALLILLFGSNRLIAEPSDFGLRILDGLKNLTKLSQLFGDVMSYLRLFALGLSSASMALVFNRLAEQVWLSAQGLGWLFALLIVLLGHGLNLLLCLMSGVVHGLRLNFIEFYRWGVTEEGHAFKAFAKKETVHD